MTTREQVRAALEEAMGHGYSSLDNFLNALVDAVEPIFRADDTTEAITNAYMAQGWFARDDRQSAVELAEVAVRVAEPIIRADERDAWVAQIRKVHEEWQEELNRREAVVLRLLGGESDDA